MNRPRLSVFKEEEDTRGTDRKDRNAGDHHHTRTDEEPVREEDIKQKKTAGQKEHRGPLPH